MPVKKYPMYNKYAVKKITMIPNTIIYCINLELIYFECFFKIMSTALNSKKLLGFRWMLRAKNQAELIKAWYENLKFCKIHKLNNADKMSIPSVFRAKSDNSLNICLWIKYSNGIKMIKYLNSFPISNLIC